MILQLQSSHRSFNRFVRLWLEATAAGADSQDMSVYYVRLLVERDSTQHICLEMSQQSPLSAPVAWDCGFQDSLCPTKLAWFVVA